jgi:hypothetical protein
MSNVGIVLKIKLLEVMQLYKQKNAEGKNAEGKELKKLHFSP